MLLNSAGDTENAYRYTGEQLDRGLDQYYLRARYYDQGAGRFTQMDTWMGNNQDPITLNKYLYANADPAFFVDPSGQYASVGSFGAAFGIAGILTTAAIQGPKFASLLDTSIDAPLSPTEVGLLTLMATNPMLMSKLTSLLGAKADAQANTSSDQVVPLFRAVEDPELASLYACQCFTLGSNGFPKQFFHTATEAHSFGNQFIKGKVKLSHYHLVEATISARLYSTLDHAASEPGIGPIVTVPSGLLAAFNADMERNGGWRYIGTY